MASSGSAVTVLTPNGRRHTVKVTPNVPMLQVLEDVCRKHGFNPEDYGLKFQRTVLDLTLQWRFANLPNNAKLEMVTSTKKQASGDNQVRIALQLEDGSRLQDSFSCVASLWELISHFPQIRESALSKSGSTPVCVYMRDEVSGEDALKTTSLKSLGLTGGAAIIRFLLKTDKTPSGGAGRVLPPAASVAKKSPPSQPAPPGPSSPKESKAAPVPPRVLSSHLHLDPPVTVTRNAPAQPEKSNAQPRSPPAHNHNPPPQPQSPHSRAQEIPAQDAEEAGPSGLNSHQSPPPPPFIPFSGGGQRLGGPSGGTAGRLLTASTSSSLTAAVGESPKAKKAKGSHSSGGSSKSTTEQDQQPGQDQFLEPVDREPLVYHLDCTSRLTEDFGDLPDEFFEVTVDDVRRRFAQLKSERKSFEEAPLLTKSLREAQMKEKLEKYPKVVLRVQFPDRHVLQGFFRPLETVSAVRDFVRTHLDDPQLRFYLFVTPPKTILDDPTVTLFQAGLFPGALLYFGSDARTGSLLRSELLETSVSALQADESVASCISSTSPDSSSSGCGAEETVPNTVAKAPEPQEPPAPKPTRTDPGKVPKWLKLPGKK